jgi:predicted protein tyrosine phosphatase
MAYTEKKRRNLFGWRKSREKSKTKSTEHVKMENAVVPIGSWSFEVVKTPERPKIIEADDYSKWMSEQKTKKKQESPLIFNSFADYQNWIVNLYSASDKAENDEKTKRKIDREVTKMKEAGISKVLFVCSANIDRSPTAENLFKNQAGLEAKSAGVSKTAFTKLTPQLIEWADQIYVMEPKYKRNVTRMVPEAKSKTTSLNIGDFYYRNQPALKKMILNQLDETF